MGGPAATRIDLANPGIARDFPPPNALVMGESKPGATPTKFGTFGGVFTPSTLTILGVIMFLRFGQVVGQSGIANALIIVLCAKLITTLTALSISAIATNTRVQGGGAYFLISRSLGVEFGGAIGIVFFLAQAISVSMYVIGFTEALLNLFPDVGSARFIASTVNLVVFICVYIGAGWTIKLQYGILAILVLSILSFFAGAIPSATMETLQANMKPSYSPGQNVFIAFALFFPAVTGIMAGVNMSGDLASPSKSIPKGTLLAIAFTGVIYLTMALLLGASRPRGDLIENSFVMLDIAWSPMLINAGIFAATLSSALGSMMGAPRILQALARDNIFPRLKSFAKGTGASNEPRNAVVLTFIIAEVGILLGDLNAIAPVITMFFMVTYGTINLACFYESITNNPSYRPTFKASHWITALLGAIGCAVVMLLMAPIPAIASIAAMAGLHWFIGRKEIQARWGNVSSGVAFERARKSLLKLEEEKYHPKNWRPTVLALSGGAWQRNHLAEFGYLLTAGHGILTLAQIIQGDVEDKVERRRQGEAKLRKYIVDNELEAFSSVVVENDLLEGVQALLQCSGIGGFKPNTLLLGWSEDPKRRVQFFKILRLSLELNRSIIMIRSAGDEKHILWSTPPSGTIDIWWKGGRNGTLQLVLAHLLSQNSEWRRHQIRVMVGVSKGSDAEKSEIRIRELLETARVKATPVVLATDDITREMQSQSASAAVVFMGFEPPEEGAEDPFMDDLLYQIGDLKNVILVSSAGNTSLTT